MCKRHSICFLPVSGLVLLSLLSANLGLRSAHAQGPRPGGTEPYVAAASDEAELAIKRFKFAPDLKVDLWAAEPMLANPVMFNFDEKGRAYVCETFRLGAGVDDIRGIMDWLDEELASRSVDEREAEMKRHLGDRFARYSDHSERLRLLEDREGTGKATRSTVFAAGFNTPLDGLAAGVLARKGDVWLANIPNLWLLRDSDGDGVADYRKSLHYGFGVRVGFLGHDLHGPRFGPDGKLYFSVGDRGSSVKVADGKTVGNPDTGCVFRCNPDGSDLEVFSYGLRNPQDLVFDQYGNLFTGDNNSDSGDQARWVYLVEGADNGWRVGYQFMERPYSRGPFNAERLWYPSFPGQAAHIVPPIANIASGPSGVAYFPGTGLPEIYKDHFFLVDFRGGAAISGIHTFTLKQKGAGFELVKPERFLWGLLATDAKFGVDGGLYVSDWVQGWGMTGKGRIYRVHAPNLDADATVLQTKRLLAEGFDQRPSNELARLLRHPDMRVRQEAQFALADRGPEAIPAFSSLAKSGSDQLARLHAIWGLGQIAARHSATASVRSACLDPVVGLLNDPDDEVCAQAAKVLGDQRYRKAFAGLMDLLHDKNSRTRFFAALALGKLGRPEALPGIYDLLRENADRDPYLRHAGVMALVWIGETQSLLAAARDASPAVRMGVLLAFRRLQRSEVALFLNDPSPALMLEAARAINDEPVNAAVPELAALLNSPKLDRFLKGEPLLARSTGDTSGSSHEDRLILEALVRRILNANFHLGLPKTAKALATFAARNDAPASMRVEALEELGDWPHPSGRDRVVGLWRPVAAHRSVDTAAQELRPQIAELLHTAPDEVRIALLRTVGKLGLPGQDLILARTVTDTNLTGKLRAEALNTLATLNSSGLEQALIAARDDADVDLRKAATRLEGKLKSSNPVVRLTATLESGTLSEQQTALATLATLPDAAADSLIALWLDRLSKNTIPRELRLDVVDAAEKRSSSQVKEKLNQYESARDKDDPLSPYQETLYGGSAAEGKRIFFERPEAQCVRCHKIDGQGGDVGPDLSHVSAQKDRKYLLESMVLPNQQIAPGFASVFISLKDGESKSGVLKSENDREVVLHSTDDGVVTVKKSDIASRNAALSPMPEGLGQLLSKDDLRNLVEFLSSLK